MEHENLIEVGEFYKKLNDIVGTNLPIQKIYLSKGFKIHLIKRKHYTCIKHINDIPQIIEHPDYVGVNPNEHGDTIELIKKFEKNILLGIKLKTKENYLFVATMHDIQESKIIRRLHSGRIKKNNY